ncbi:guanine nucleotide exchange protein for ADP-robosylation factor [Agyrium rufum]|nr:guanine nucleotide exchange protein for ADP-robosylation factor [Agyrium rufum]
MNAADGEQDREEQNGIDLRGEEHTEEGDVSSLEKGSASELAIDKKPLAENGHRTTLSTDEDRTNGDEEEEEEEDDDQSEQGQEVALTKKPVNGLAMHPPGSTPPERPSTSSPDTKDTSSELPQIPRTIVEDHDQPSQSPLSPTRDRAESRSSIGTNGLARRSTSLSSMVFVQTALEAIAASKEAKRSKPLNASVQKALLAIKKDGSPSPEEIFEPLRLATETSNIQLTTTALDCIGKLITYSYFSLHPATEQTHSDQPQVPLIERAIDTICDCFQDEATPAEIQLQIVKSLLAAVLNDKIIVHGAGLLKAVRQIYNIFLLSKSGPNQQVAQGTLTQMVGTVFERVKTRLATKEARLNMSKLNSGGVTANTSQTDLNGTSLTVGSGDHDGSMEGDTMSEAASVAPSDQPVRKEPGEKMTLQSFENAKNFDDTRIGDNAPTMVTRVRPNTRRPRIPPARTASGQTQHDGQNGSEDLSNHEFSDEDEEDEIYVKDAFLVFRSMCRLSTKTLPQEQLQDLKSQNMRSKLISLSIIRTCLNNNMEVFTSPLVTIRSSVNNEPSSFGQAINQYLRLALSRNGASSVKQVFETGCEIFWLMLKYMRVMLKREIEVFLKEIYLAILERKNAANFQKIYIMRILARLANEPQALVEIYLNYDCDRSALDNMFQRTIEHLSRLSSTPITASPQQQQLYQEHHAKDLDSDIDWSNHGNLPPSLTIASLSGASSTDSDLPVDYILKQQSLECLVRTLRALSNWSQEILAASVARLQDSDSKLSFEEIRESLEPTMNGSSPRPHGGDQSTGPGTPLLEDNFNQLEQAKLKKTALTNAIRQFNFKPKRGVKALLKDGFIASDTPEDIAQFLLQEDRLDKAMIGEFLGEGEQYNISIMHAFVDAMDFTKRRFVDSLRLFLQSFRLPGEAQKIDRFMLKFAERYITGNPNAFANADTAYVLAYSVIMLNTDQHSDKLKGQRRMTKEDFIKNNRGINDDADLPDDYLVGIYEEIAHHEIVLKSEREKSEALGLGVQPSSGSIAQRAGQALFTNRDLQTQAIHQASEEMQVKAEERIRKMIRAQKRTTSKNSNIRYIPATSFKHVGPMFDVTWMSFLSGFSGQMQDTQNLQTIKTCMEGLKLSIRISCLFDLETPRVAFVRALAKFTNLGNVREMMVKNLEALRVLLEIAQSEGNMLKRSWSDILTCISQLDRFQLISGGLDEDVIPDVRKANIVPKAQPGRRSQQSQRRVRPGATTAALAYQQDVAQETRSADMIKAVDRIFTSTAQLNGDAIVYFVRALSEVSWQEIQSSGQIDSPRTYSLQKLVEISYYNMTRVRFEWTNIWQVLGEHFNQVGCHSNTNVVFFALDSLRQLSMRFMELEELPGFKFQKDFLKPFEHVMVNSSVVRVKDMVLSCLIQMIQARGENIRSGWKTMFGVFTVAAREPYEALVNLAFDNVTSVYNTRFGMVISQGAFADLIVCLTEFSKNLKFQKKSLQAIEMLKSTVPKMLKTPECPLSHKKDAVIPGSTPESAASQRQTTRQTQEEQFWFPVLFAFHDVLMTGDDLEVRSQALNYLFDILIRYGGEFPRDFWDILWRQLLYPIFMVLKSKSEMTKVLNHEDLSVWLSTTMIQALRNMISLFTHYFESLEYMLDRFLDLLALCICQENDTIARIGSNCLQTLILQNVNKFKLEHWHKIVSAFVELFARTTAQQLFTAATSSSSSSYIEDDDGRSTFTESNGLPLEPSESHQDEAGESPTANGLHKLQTENTSATDTNSATQPSSPPETHPSSATSELEDYRPHNSPQQQPVVVTAARRRFFNKIITRCVLQLLMIETVNELFSNNDVYAQIPSPELLRLMSLLKASYSFAKRFNNDKELRMRLWREGFMKQPPNLLKQESGSAATYVSILVRMYFDEGEERRRNRAETEAALIPLCADIIRSYTLLDPDSQQRNIFAWRPVVVDVMEAYTNFPSQDFETHIETFYPLSVDLLGRELGSEVRIALQGLLRRIGECRMGMPPREGSFSAGNGAMGDGLRTPTSGTGMTPGLGSGGLTPTTPRRSESGSWGKEQYFSTRRGSRSGR